MPQSWRFDPDESCDYANIAWWEQLEDPVLNELIALALKNNQDLKVATGRVLEFYAQYKIVSSKLYPEVDLNVSYLKEELTNGLNYAPIPPGTRFNNLYTAFFNFSYEIDFWGKLRNASDAAKSQYLSQIDARRNVVLTLISNVASSYVLLRQFDDQLAVSKKTWKTRLDYLELSTLRYEGGLVSEMEVKQAASEADSAQVEVERFEALIPQQEDLISVLIGEPSRAIERGALLTELKMAPCVPTGIPSSILENRPDILQAEQELIAANAEIGVAKAAFFPSISLTSAYGSQSTALKNFFSSSGKMWDYGLAALQPIYTGQRLTYQVKLAEAIKIQAYHSYYQTVLTAFQEVNDALIGHEKAKKIVVVRTSQVADLQDYLELSILRYDNGQNDYLTVLDAERMLFEAQLALCTSEGDVFLTLIGIYKALGKGWEVEED